MLVSYYVLHYQTQLNFHRETVKKHCFTLDSLVNEPLSPERIFVSSMSIRWKFFIKGLLYCKSLIVINRKMFQLVIDENRMVVTQKMTLIETFLGGTMYNVHIEVASLVYIYVGSRTIPVINIRRSILSIIHKQLNSK